MVCHSPSRANSNSVTSLIIKAVFNGFTGEFAPVRTPAHMKAPQAVQQMQTIPNSSSGPFDSTIDDHPTLETYVDIPPLSPGYPFHFGHQAHPSLFPTSNVMPSSSSSAMEDVANLVHDERQAPVAVHQTPERTSSIRQRGQRARAIKIDGLWIDKDDLYNSARQGGMISIHKCRWATSSNPCGMWIIGSRPLVGAHVRKWHSQKRVDKTAKCLWDGCATTKAMLAKSINRHAVTVHLEEGFHCHGCNQAFSRKDVYDKHMESSKVCRDAGVAIAYGTEHRVIDIRRALQCAGDAVCYTGC